MSSTESGCGGRNYSKRCENRFVVNSLSDDFFQFDLNSFLSFSQRIVSETLKKYLDKNLSEKEERKEKREKLYLNCGLEKTNDPSIYCGKGGVVFMLLELYFYNCKNQEQNKIKIPELLRIARKILNQSLEMATRDEHFNNVPSFLLGITGLHTLDAVLCSLEGREDSARRRIQRVIKCANLVLSEGGRRGERGSSVDNELLYGRAGYLFALSYLKKHLPSLYGDIPEKIPFTLCDLLFQEGESSAQFAEKWKKGPSSPPPLLFPWHQTPYLGAAHGLIGILHTLLSFPLSEKRKLVVQECIERILSGALYPSGNVAPVWGGLVDEQDDLLFHWCHGAPGFVSLLLSAHSHFKSEKYLKFAERLGDLIWERGLLRKGLGLCHGICGNGFAFLSLYRHTKQDKWLHRARQFGMYGLGWKGDVDEDSVRYRFSLFDGSSGVVCYYLSLVDPDYSHFPCYEL